MTSAPSHWPVHSWFMVRGCVCTCPTKTPQSPSHKAVLSTSGITRSGRSAKSGRPSTFGVELLPVYRQYIRWSLRCSWSITYQCCSNYIFIFNLTPGFKRLGRNSCKMRRETFNFWDQVQLILENLRYVSLSNGVTQAVVEGSFDTDESCVHAMVCHQAANTNWILS